MYSKTALKIYALKKRGVIKSRSGFWKAYSDKNAVAKTDIDTAEAERELNEKNYSLICAFDDDFPVIGNEVKSADKPYLLAYKGDISLIKSRAKNVAVVGTLYSDRDIASRERKIVELLSENGINIVSGLAKGCDTVAHEVCVKGNGKTVAILPSTLDNIYPKENVGLSEKIIKSGGLVLTEYIDEPKNKYEAVGRFIERDRLQAMFSDSVILISSYRQSEGDSGSRHAMNKAVEYGIKRFVMYNDDADSDNPLFGLNKDLVGKGEKSLTGKSIKEIIGSQF